VELKASAVDLAGPGIARFMILDTKELHAVLERTWDLAVSLPDHPLRRFEAETAGLPRNTEAERMVIQRRGQDVFRDSLLKYWGHRCPLTGISEEQLLRASHIKPWAVCDTDEERLDPYNGLLLSSLWDSAFDAGLVSFDDWGQILSSGHLTSAAQQTLGTASLISLSFQHLPYLQWHREHIFLG
jgi:hypothetical protein